MRPSKRCGLALVIVVGVASVACGAAQAPRADSPSSETTVGSSASPSASQVHVTGAASFPDIRDLRHLVWASNWIVRGRVVEERPAQRFPAENGPLGDQTPQEYYDTQIYTDYVLAVDQVFRGHPRDTIVVRRMGGTVDSVTLTSEGQPELRVGDDVVVFLVPPAEPQPGDGLWETGGPQGHWRVTDNQVVPVKSDYPTLPVAQFGQAIADALRQGPPADMGRPLVPLQMAPAGPDLPSVSTPEATSITWLDGHCRSFVESPSRYQARRG